MSALVAGAGLGTIAACGSDPEAPVLSPSAAEPGALDDAGLKTDSGLPRRGSDAASGDGSVVSAPCVGKTGEKGDRTITMTSGGVERTFDVHVPNTYSPTQKAPLAFVFHGYTMTAAQMASATHFSDSADKRGMIAVFPSGVGGGFNAGECCGSAQTDKVDDVGFTRDMIAKLSAEYCVDSKRTFATGFSNGAFLSYKLACELSDRIAAIAPVSGGIQANPDTCKPTRPIAVMHVHGTGDLLVPYLGGGAALERPISASIEAFRTLNKCPAGNGQSVYDKGAASCTSWGPCSAGTDVELCTISLGGHQWPGGDTLPYGGVASQDLNASEAIADFFLAHPMP